MYMGVIPFSVAKRTLVKCAPHVYGGDPAFIDLSIELNGCSPCIWG